VSFGKDTTVSFGIGLGPMMWLLISEIYRTKIRGKAMSLATLSVGHQTEWRGNILIATSSRRAGEDLLALRLHLCGGFHILLCLFSGDQGAFLGRD
jgi:hypothetical protein